jgi:hypothetical protein
MEIHENIISDYLLNMKLIDILGKYKPTHPTLSIYLIRKILIDNNITNRGRYSKYKALITNAASPININQRQSTPINAKQRNATASTASTASTSNNTPDISDATAEINKVVNASQELISKAKHTRANRKK